MDVAQRDFHALIGRDIDAGNTRHILLLMLWGVPLYAFSAHERLAGNEMPRREGADYRNRERSVNADFLQFSAKTEVFWSSATPLKTAHN